MSGTTQAFWSYVRKDDEGTHGAIGRLAENLIAEYEVLTGGEGLDLFFDRVSLKWGDNWISRIRESLEGTTFFIPIITPGYFASDECRKELLSFAKQEDELGVRGLIMPIYFIDVTDLKGDADDPAMRLIAQRQREDWRNLRLLDETVQPYRVAVNRLAARLLDASRERETAKSQPSDKSLAQDDEEANGQSKDLVPRSSDPTHPAEDEPGIMELLAAGEEALPRIVETLNEIRSPIDLVGSLARAATEEVKASDSAGKGFRGRLAVMNRMAVKLAEPADELETLTSRYAGDLLLLDPAMKQLIRLLHEQSEDDPAAAEEFFDMVKGMVKASSEAAENIQELINSFETPQQFSRELRVPLKRMRVSLQSMIDGHDMMASWQTQIEENPGS